MAIQGIRWGLLVGFGLVLIGHRAEAQMPTLPTEFPQAMPGSNTSALGPLPGSGGATFSSQASGAGQILGGRPGSATPRVPTSISTPGSGENPAQSRISAIPPVALLTEVPLYGSLELPGLDDDGPPDGLTYDQALEVMLRENLELIARQYEIPLAQADVLTASLRANPIFYADSQLVPYGEYTRNRPGGQTQYDVNISYPVDFSHKRKYRTIVAKLARRVTEAQYQDAVRGQINNLGIAYVGVLSARETVRYIQAGLKGFDELLRVSRELKVRSARTSADVSRIEAQRELAVVGLLDAEEALRRAKRTLGGLLNMPPDQAEVIEIRASLRDDAPPPPDINELTRIALQCRPDVISFRLGVDFARSGLDLQKANKYSDAYVLLQPYTFQNNSPVGLKSATSYAVGVTVPLPIYNRNQGNIERARTNINQTKVQLDDLQRKVVIEVRSAEREYASTRTSLDRLEKSVISSAKKGLVDTRELFKEGELSDVTQLLNAEQSYNQIIRQYRDTAVRHRQSMINLNTVVGARILP